MIGNVFFPDAVETRVKIPVIRVLLETLPFQIGGIDVADAVAVRNEVNPLSDKLRTDMTGRMIVEFFETPVLQGTPPDRAGEPAPVALPVGQVGAVFADNGGYSVQMDIDPDGVTYIQG